MANNWHELIQQVIDLQEDPEMNTEPGPALQWYPDKWLGDSKVMLMSMTARGTHHHLLMLAWKGFDLEDDSIPGSVPDDPDLLKAICQRPADWDEIWPEVGRAWKSAHGRLWNLGLCKTYVEQMKNRRRRSHSGRKAAKSRWQGKGGSPQETPKLRQLSSTSKTDDVPAQGDSMPDACEAQGDSMPNACDSQGGSMSNACDSHDGQIPNACDSHPGDGSNDAIGSSVTSPVSVPVSVSSSVPVEEEGGVQRGIQGQVSKDQLAPDVDSLPIPLDERHKVSQLLDAPDRIDPSNNRASKLTDEKAVRRERIHLLAQLADRTGQLLESRAASGESEDTALDLWNAWRARRKAKVKVERQPWFSEVQALRRLLDGKHTPEEMMQALLKAGSAGWQGFEWKWLNNEGVGSTQQRSRPITGAAGFLPAADDGIAV